MHPLLQFVNVRIVAFACVCTPTSVIPQTAVKSKSPPAQTVSREKRLIEAIDRKDLARVNTLLDAGLKPGDQR